MPAPAVAAGVTAAGGIIGGALSARSNARASRVQRQSNVEAIALERERDAEERRRYDEQQAALKQAWEEREARRNALLQRYGRGTQTRTMPPGWTPGAASGAPPTQTPRVAISGSPMEENPLTPPLAAPRHPWGDWGV